MTRQRNGAKASAFAPFIQLIIIFLVDRSFFTIFDPNFVAANHNQPVKDMLNHPQKTELFNEIRTFI